MNPLAGPAPALLRAYIGDEGGPGNAAMLESHPASRPNLRRAAESAMRRAQASKGGADDIETARGRPGLRL